MAGEMKIVQLLLERANKELGEEGDRPLQLAVEEHLPVLCLLVDEQKASRNEWTNNIIAATGGSCGAAWPAAP